MRRAFDLAWGVAGSVAPRPAVGAVIVRDNTLVGEGATESRPGLHAETIAIAQAGELAIGATLYCTLEPHGFQGVSAPCTEAVVAAGIRKVLVDGYDPNPKVCGNGIEQLRRAGIETTVLNTGRSAHELYEGYHKLITQGAPFVTLKVAMSADGKTATKHGESKWITGRESRMAVHGLRRRADILLTSIGTVLADDPRLTIRDGQAVHTPIVAVLDSEARMPQNARLLNRPLTIWFTALNTNPPFKTAHIKHIGLKRHARGLDLAQAMDKLAQMGYAWVLSESGARLNASLLDAGLVDRLELFIAPLVVGGDARPVTLGDGSRRLDDASKWDFREVCKIGRDIRLTAYKV